jgi:hypothetical protein
MEWLRLVFPMGNPPSSVRDGPELIRNGDDFSAEVWAMRYPVQDVFNKAPFGCGQRPGRLRFWAESSPFQDREACEMLELDHLFRRRAGYGRFAAYCQTECVLSISGVLVMRVCSKEVMIASACSAAGRVYCGTSSLRLLDGRSGSSAVLSFVARPESDVRGTRTPSSCLCLVELVHDRLCLAYGCWQ